ncbi:hypothetical protein D3C76_1143510 [compost metagenome]
MHIGAGAHLRRRHQADAKPGGDHLEGGLAALHLDGRTYGEAGALHLVFEYLAGHGAALAQHHRHVLQVGEDDGLARRPGVRVGDEGHQRVAAQHMSDQAVVLHHPAKQGEVRLVLLQPAQAFIAVAGDQADADARITVAEARDMPQQVHRRIHRQDEAAGLQGAGGGEQFLSLGLGGEQALGDGQEAFAQVSQLYGTLVAVEQQNAETLLQFAHLVGNRRLAEEQRFGRAGEIAVHRHGVEGFQLRLGNRHLPILLQISSSYF